MQWYVLFAFLFLLAGNPASLAETSQGNDLGRLSEFIKQNAKAISKARGASRAAVVAELIRQKFLNANNLSAWSVNPYPQENQVSSLKPRIRVNTPAGSTEPALAPRWDIYKVKTDDGCVPLSSPAPSTSLIDPNGICSNSAVAFTVDNSKLGSVETAVASGAEQKAYVVAPDPQSLSESEQLKLFSDPSFYLSDTSASLVAVPVKFTGFVLQSSPNTELRLKVQIDEVEVQIPLVPPPTPTCSLSSNRQEANQNNCDVTVSLRDGVSASSAPPSFSGVSPQPLGNWNSQMNSWNGTVACSPTAFTSFSASVGVSGFENPISCNPSPAVVVPAPVLETKQNLKAITRCWDCQNFSWDFAATPPVEIFSSKISQSKKLEVVSASGRAYNRIFGGWGTCGAQDSYRACPDDWKVTFLNGSNQKIGDGELSLTAPILVPAGAQKAVMGFADPEDKYFDNEGCVDTVTVKNGNQRCNYIERETCSKRTTNGCTFNLKLSY